MVPLSVACIIAFSATAQTMESIAKSAGLLGVWASDCSKPASMQNGYVTHAVGTRGKLATTTNNGFIERMEIESMRALSQTTVAMRIRYVEPKWMSSYGKVLETVVEVNGDHLRLLRSVGPDGAVLAENGILMTNKRPVPWLERCGRKPSTPKPPTAEPTV
jgi:hypothetical protein